MLLYELITLKLPFEGQEQLKDIILNGGRPLIRPSDLEYPTLALDLMCLCWSDTPSERPTASQICAYTSSFEFAHLMDVCILDEFERLGANGSLLVATTVNQEEDEDDDDDLDDELNRMGIDTTSDDDDDDDDEVEDLIDVWVVRNCPDEGVSQFEVLTYESRLNCTARKQINVCNEKVEALCVYNANQIWCVDSLKAVFVYW